MSEKIETHEKTVKTVKTEKAVAFRHARKAGPSESPVQVRNAGKDELRNAPAKWDEQDEAVDESFPASDASAKY